MVSRKKGLVTRTIAGEAIIVPVCDGVGDMDSVFTLNGPGTAIWDRIDGSLGVDAIAAALAAEYDVESDRARGDVEEFLDALLEKGLIDRD
jgi:hypothetical protein